MTQHDATTSHKTIAHILSKASAVLSPNKVHFPGRPFFEIRTALGEEIEVYSAEERTALIKEKGVTHVRLLDQSGNGNHSDWLKVTK